jgi:hypothetical protein
MKYIKLFESFGNDADSIAEEIDNWIDSNSDYMSASSLEDKLKELIGSDDIKVTETVERSSEGDEYGEDWSTTIICAKYKGQDLMKVCVNSSKAYDFGKNSIMFRELPSNKVVKDEPYHIGVRFYLDKNLI